jgi:hypothetical protein
MRTPNNWIAVVLVAVLVGMASRPAHAEGTSIASPVPPLSPRYLRQTLAPVEPGAAPMHGTLRHAQVAPPGPGTDLAGSRLSLKEQMWAAVVVALLVIDAVLATSRD